MGAVEKSKGHRCFCRPAGLQSSTPTVEYFEKGGEIFRAPVSNPVMTDGYRCGRFECHSRQWGHLASLMFNGAGFVLADGEGE